jgi:hypothetical protein
MSYMSYELTAMQRKSIDNYYMTQLYSNIVHNAETPYAIRQRRAIFQFLKVNKTAIERKF